MKAVRKVFFGLAVLGIVVFLSGISFAKTAPAAEKDLSARKAKHEARVKLLKDAAAVLQQSNPDLAKGLQEIAEGKQKSTEPKGSPAWQAEREARLKLLKDAAVALQQSNPALAKNLQEMSEHKPITETQKKTQEKTGKMK